jgi:hypothetical protein
MHNRVITNANAGSYDAPVANVDSFADLNFASRFPARVHSRGAHRFAGAN